MVCFRPWVSIYFILFFTFFFSFSSLLVPVDLDWLRAKLIELQDLVCNSVITYHLNHRNRRDLMFFEKKLFCFLFYTVDCKRALLISRIHWLRRKTSVIIVKHFKGWALYAVPEIKVKVQSRRKPGGGGCPFPLLLPNSPTFWMVIIYKSF